MTLGDSRGLGARPPVIAPAFHHCPACRKAELAAVRELDPKVVFDGERMRVVGFAKSQQEQATAWPAPAAKVGKGGALCDRARSSTEP
jgi:hypothetical protein